MLPRLRGIGGLQTRPSSGRSIRGYFKGGKKSLLRLQWSSTGIPKAVRSTREQRICVKRRNLVDELTWDLLNVLHVDYFPQVFIIEIFLVSIYMGKWPNFDYLGVGSWAPYTACVYIRPSIPLVRMPLPSPRVYPVAFAREILDSVEAMKASTHGQPALPNPLPTAFETFTTMKWSTDDDIWGFVDFAQLFNYIRNNRSLRIPSEWKAVVPKTMWPAFKTCTIMYQTFVYPNSLLVYIASMMLEWFRSQWLPAFQVELYAFTWFYVIFLEKSSGLPRTRTKPVPNPYQTRTNPYYFPENLGFISISRVSSTRTKPVPNPYFTRTNPYF